MACSYCLPCEEVVDRIGTVSFETAVILIELSRSVRRPAFRLPYAEGERVLLVFAIQLLALLGLALTASGNRQ